MDQKTAYEKKQGAMRRKSGLRTALTYLFLSIWAVVVLFPFYWMVLSSLKSYSAYTPSTPPSFSPWPPPGKTMKTPSPQYPCWATC